MNERLTKCPLCDSGLFLNQQSVKDHVVSQEIFTLCQCQNCSLVFTNPRPDAASIMKYYDSEDYISHQDKSTSLINFLYKQIRKVTIKKKISWIKAYNKSKLQLLDYGCGTGYLLNEAKKQKGWQVMGIEPNLTARKNASNFGLNVFEKIEDIPEAQKFDVITLFHVLEHIHLLKETLQQILDKLKNNGTLFLAVPNLNSFDAHIYKNEWAALDVPRHLYHFTSSSMQKLAEEMDLKIIDQKPMVFDSYYVSMLSEKFLPKSSAPFTQIINAIVNGYQSNRWARKNNHNYSSILFILKKK